MSDSEGPKRRQPRQSENRPFPLPLLHAAGDPIIPVRVLSNDNAYSPSICRCPTGVRRSSRLAQPLAGQCDPIPIVNVIHLHRANQEATRGFERHIYAGNPRFGPRIGTRRSKNSPKSNISPSLRVCVSLYLYLWVFILVSFVAYYIVLLYILHPVFLSGFGFSLSSASHATQWLLKSRNDLIWKSRL